MEGLKALLNIWVVLIAIAAIVVIGLFVHTVVRDPKGCLSIAFLALIGIASVLALLWGIITGAPILVWMGFIVLAILFVVVIVKGQ